MTDKPSPAMLDIVRRLMWRKSWITVFELQRDILLLYNRPASDSGLTARIRDLRKGKNGGWTVECRVGKGQTYEYRLIH